MSTQGVVHSLQFSPLAMFDSTPADDSIRPANSPPPQWYAAFTLSRHEKKAVEHCQQRRIDSFLPLYRVTHKWKNRQTVDLELPLFPCYFFVQITPRNRVRVLEIPGVVSIVSAAGQLLPIADEQIQALRDGLLVHRIEPHPDLEVGDTVRIKAGPFAGTHGILNRHKNGLRVVLKLEMLARSVSVEVDADEIE